MADRCPIELWEDIFARACTDGGRTGRALSRVSRSVRTMTEPVRYYSLALDTHQITGLLSRLNQRQITLGLPPSVFHLFIDESEYDRSRRNGTWPRRADPTVAQVNVDMLLALVAPTLDSLALMTGQELASPLPHLRALTLARFPAILSLPYPCLRSLHVADIQGSYTCWTAIARLSLERTLFPPSAPWRQCCQCGTTTSPEWGRSTWCQGGFKCQACWTAERASMRHRRVLGRRLNQGAENSGAFEGPVTFKNFRLSGVAAEEEHPRLALYLGGLLGLQMDATAPGRVANGMYDPAPLFAGVQVYIEPRTPSNVFDPRVAGGSYRAQATSTQELRTLEDVAAASGGQLVMRRKREGTYSASEARVEWLDYVAGGPGAWTGEQKQCPNVPEKEYRWGASVLPTLREDYTVLRLAPVFQTLQDVAIPLPEDNAVLLPALPRPQDLQIPLPEDYTTLPLAPWSTLVESWTADGPGY